MSKTITPSTVSSTPPRPEVAAGPPTSWLRKHNRRTSEILFRYDAERWIEREMGGEDDTPEEI